MSELRKGELRGGHRIEDEAEAVSEQERRVAILHDDGRWEWFGGGASYLGGMECAEFVPADREGALVGALRLAEEAIAYAREPHHLDHSEECSLCAVATDHLDLALGKARATLASLPPQEPER